MSAGPNGATYPARSSRSFPRAFLDELRARTPIAALIGRHVQLSRSGSDHIGLCPFHSETTPSLHVYQDHFHCFGCDAHGDAIQFVIDTEHVNLGQAVERLARDAGLPLPNGHASETKATSWQPIVPAPADVPMPSDADLDCDLLHVYRGPDGALLFYIRRHEAVGARAKVFKPLTYGRLNDRMGWVCKAPNAPRPLYGLDRLAMHPNAEVIICEGEKAADAAQKLFPDRPCVSWSGGSNAVDKADWEPLRRRAAIVWPDADAPGHRAASRIARLVPGARILRVDDLPEGHDAADVHPDDPEQWLRDRLPDHGDGPPDEPQPASTHDDDGGDRGAGSDVDTVVRRFNQQYRVVNEAGRAVIFQPGFDQVLKRRLLYRLTFRDLQQLYMNSRVCVGTNRKGKRVYAKVADVWLGHRDRRQFINGVVFDPGGNVAPGVLNLWEGYAVKPAPGDWSLMREHIREIICAGDPVRFDYFIRWIARLLQKPGEQGEVAVVLKGGEGTGKGTVAKALRQIIGHHALAISNGRHLVGNFNSHLRDCVFLFADEAFFAGDRAHVGVLKSLITEATLTVEAKYANAVETPNYLHLMMASNEEWVVPASIDARRFFVLVVSEAVKNNHTYFGAIWSQMEAGGYAAMLHDMLATDLTNFNVRAVPTTEGLQDQRKLSLPTTEAWWLDVLERGYVFRSKLGLEADLSVWHPKVSTELLFASYTEFAKARAERRLLTRENLGRFLSTMGSRATRWRNGVVGEHIADVPNPYGGTTRKAELVKQQFVHGYQVGSLADARRDFIRTTGIPVAWDSGTIGGSDDDQ